MAGHRGASTQLHGASGAMRRSGPIAGETLSPLQGDVDDAPVSKWMEDAANSRAQAIRHGSDDWEPQLGDGAKTNARQSAKSDGMSPRFEMASMDGIMARARDMSSGAMPPGPGKGREPPRAHSTSPAASSLVDPPSRASTATSLAWGHPSAAAAAAEVPPPAQRQRPVARSRAEFSAAGKTPAAHAPRSSTPSTSDSLGGIRTKDGGIWPQHSAPELGSYGIQGVGASSAVLSDGRPVPPMPLPVDQRGRTSPVQSPKRNAVAVSPSQSTSGAADHKPAGLTVSSIPTRDIVQQDARAMLNHLQTCPGGVNATDAAGWTCLHWAALDGKEEHVAALLDSAAEASMLTTQPVDDDKLSSGVRNAGTSAATLARFPAEGAKGHSRVVKLITAAERGAFRLRREHKQRGDTAMNNGDFSKAVEEYERVLGAVLQLEDTAAMTVRSALNMAEEAVQRQEEEAMKAAEAERQAAQLKHEEEEAAKEQKRAQTELAKRTLREAEAALDEGEQEHISQALQTIEPLMEEAYCAGDLRDFLWRVASRIQGQLRVSEARSTQRAEELADIEIAKSSLNLELGTARGEVEALNQVVAQRAEEAETLKRTRAEATEALARLEKETASVREDCTKQLESSQKREETLLSERRAQDAALEELRDTIDDLRVQLTTANAQLSSMEEQASNERVGLQGTVSAKEAELSAAMSVNATLESKVEEALAGAEKALEQAAVWQAKAEEEAEATEAVKRDLVAAGAARTKADEDALQAREELKREHEAALQKQLYAAASAKDEHDAMIDELQSAASQRAEEAAQRLSAAELVSETVRAELAEEVAARAADKVAANQAIEAQAAIAAKAQDEIKAAGALALEAKEAQMLEARQEAVDALTKCKMERDSTEAALLDAEKQLETHREEAAETLRKLSDAEAGFTDERAKLEKAVQDAEQAAIEAKEDGERTNTELKEQASWRETLRKKVEERCVKLEATVASFTANNAELTQQLATTSAALAKAQSRVAEAEERTATVEAEVGSARALVAEAETAVADLKKASAAEVKVARQGRTAMADQLEQLQGELAAATSKVGEGWSQQVATSAAVEEVKAELRTCKETLGSRELELEQAKDALTKADAARARLRSAHEADLKEITAEGAAKAKTLLAEVAELRTKLEASKQAAAEASEAAAAKDAALDSAAVARAAAELRANQRGETIAEQAEALAEASKEAQTVASKAVEELSVVMAARQAAERDAETLRSEAASLVDARRVAEENAEIATKEARAAAEARSDAERREAAARAREDTLEGRLTELEQAWKDDLSRAAREKAALTDIILGKQGCPTLEQLQAEAAEAAAAKKKLKEPKVERHRQNDGVGPSSAIGRGNSSREARDTTKERAGGREEQHDRRITSKGRGGAGAASASGATGASGRRGRRAARPASSSSSDTG